MRTTQHKYIEYSTGERELYDLIADPYELQNLAGSASVTVTQASLRNLFLSMRRCVGATCLAPLATARLGAGSTLELQVTGVAGVPSDAAAVVLNITAVNAFAPGFATVYPCGQARPEASNLNYAAAQTVPNLVITKPGVGGKVCIYSYAAIDVLADVSGFFPAGSGFTAISNPTRVLDTRNGIG